MSTSREAFDILEKIDSDNVKILFDIYHQQITEGNLYSNIFDHLNQIGHFHAAAVPGRGPITGGEINYTYLLQELADNGYDGYVGLEYMTAFSAEESLKKLWKYIGISVKRAHINLWALDFHCIFTVFRRRIMRYFVKNAIKVRNTLKSGLISYFRNWQGFLT